MAGSTAPSQGYEGYGYKWWLPDLDSGNGPLRCLRVIFGQTIAVDPKAKLVIAVHSNAQISASGSAYGQELEAATLAAISEHLR